MPGWVKWGNWFVAKLIEILFNGPSLTDAGCTFKLITKDVANKTLNLDLTNSSHYNEQLLVFLCKNKIRFVEIPINYYRRIGKSKITGGNNLATLKLGSKMIVDVLISRLISSKLSL